MFYNPFRKIYENSDWFDCCKEVLAGHYFDNPTNPTLGLLDYLFILPALIKIAEFYSPKYFILKTSLRIVSSILTIGTSLVSWVVTVAISPVLWLGQIPFIEEKEHCNERKKEKQDSSHLILESLPEDFPRGLSEIIVGYAQAVDVTGHQQGIVENIYENILFKNRRLNINLPENFGDYACSMTELMMFDPVKNESCVHNYERTVIEAWCDRQRWEDPQTEQNKMNVISCPCCPEPITQLVENQEFKKEITEFLTGVYLQLEENIGDNDPNDENNIKRRKLVTMSKNFLMYGNSERLLQQKYDKFLANRACSSKDDDILYEGSEISSCRIG
ncbi:MAG: U-box domain [Gammaproteobacteria bacterium]|jgi:hypothetical protein|nr:U-box domain [Gammaproteobacteria bacterium]